MQVELNEGKVTVKVTRELQKDQLLQINPSAAYAGIDRGVIVITEVGTRGDLSEDNQAIAESFVDADLSLIDVEDKEMMVNEKERFDSGVWVGYQYTATKEESCLPLEEFLDHSMIY